MKAFACAVKQWQAHWALLKDMHLQTPRYSVYSLKKKKSKKGSSTDLHIKVHLQVLKHYYICGKRLTKAFSISRAELCDEMPVTWANQTSVARSLSLEIQVKIEAAAM